MGGANGLNIYYKILSHTIPLNEQAEFFLSFVNFRSILSYSIFVCFSRDNRHPLVIINILESYAYRQFLPPRTCRTLAADIPCKYPELEPLMGWKKYLPFFGRLFFQPEIRRCYFGFEALWRAMLSPLF